MFLVTSESSTIEQTIKELFISFIDLSCWQLQELYPNKSMFLSLLLPVIKGILRPVFCDDDDGCTWWIVWSEWHLDLLHSYNCNLLSWAPLHCQCVVSCSTTMYCRCISYYIFPCTLLQSTSLHGVYDTKCHKFCLLHWKHSFSRQ